ncbi:hypothetical protein MKW94_001443 [Papaver nudicaule]|uniref:Uncharacterized protein n=1 Tax=Papaver nudicaule TaxID=74823 RepID=A0AA41W1R6_PAPNU|nr:hypothetical protein [Papaver nudicaule]
MIYVSNILPSRQQEPICLEDLFEDQHKQQPVYLDDLFEEEQQTIYLEDFFTDQQQQQPVCLEDLFKDQVRRVNSFSDTNYFSFLPESNPERSSTHGIQRPASPVYLGDTLPDPVEPVCLSDYLPAPAPGIDHAKTAQLSEILGLKFEATEWVDPFKSRVTDEVQNLTRSGRIYKPSNLRDDNVTTTPAPPSQGLKSAAEEDKEIVEQLRKTKENISIWGLLMASTSHREAVLAELNSSHVCSSISPEELAGTVARVIRENLLTFSDEDLPTEGKEHNRALHITVGCEGFYVPHVLIDNGSGVNICTLAKAKKIGIREEEICFRSDTVRTVRGFDNEKRSVMGEFTTTIVIGPAHTRTTFLVIDINTSYTMLLGRPWLHANLAVGSTLHQKLRFIYEDKLITMQGYFEEGESKSKSNHATVPATETEPTVQNYQEEHVHQVVNRAPAKEKIPSWFEHGHTRVAHYLRKQKNNGRTEPLDGQKISHEVPYGLGYQPTENDRLEHELEKSQRVRRAGKCVGINWKTQPSLNGHFIRKGDTCCTSRKSA